MADLGDVGYGVSPWGLGFWGGALPFNMLNAYAPSPRIVRVTLSREPLHISPFLEGDALNPSTWEITDLDNNRRITPVGVKEYIPPHTYDIYTLTPLSTHLRPHRVGSTRLKTAAGVLVGFPGFVDFRGNERLTLSAPLPEGSGIIDVANRDFFGTGKAMDITAGGTYALDTGIENLRKRIYRRLVTKKGEFAHLPDYGVGFREKELLPIPDFPKLRTEVERQIAQEPDVETVQATVTYIPENTIHIQLLVKPRFVERAVPVGFAFPEIMI